MAAETHTSANHSQDGHHAGPSRYFFILLVLIALTVVTRITGRMDLGAANLPLALAIACTKATLVILFFMHMIEAEAMNRIIFAVSVLFLFIFLLGSFADVATRFKPAIPEAGERSAPLAIPRGHGHGAHAGGAHASPTHGGGGETTHGEEAE